MSAVLTSSSSVLCSGTLPRSTPVTERIEVAVAAGFDALSLWGRDRAEATTGGWTDTDLRLLFADAGLQIAEIDGVWDWTPHAPTIPAGVDPFLDHDERDLLEIGEALGARSVNAVDVFGGDWTLDDAAESFAGLCDRANEHGLLVHLEALPFSRIPTVTDALFVVRQADRPNGGVLVDAWHLFRSHPSAGAALDAIAHLDAARVFAVQMGDGPAAPEPDLMTAALHDRCLPGDGDFELGSLVQALDAIGSNAPLGIEVFSDALQARPANEVADLAMASLRRVAGGGAAR